MATFKEAYLDLATMVSDAKKSTGLSEEALIELFKTQLVYGQAPITNAVEVPAGEYIGEIEAEFTEDEDDDEGNDDGATIIPFTN